MPSDPLDRGLAAGFGPSSTPANSVLHVIERITGEAPRVMLRDSASEHGNSPVIDLSSPDRKAIPQGRGSYQLLGEIASGGMGVVMKGHDMDLGRDVALKVLHKNLAQRPEVVQRFVEEAQIGGQLQHPGIVPVYELGLMADERPYFTMKLVKGRTLAVLLSERKVATAERRKLLDVFESVCQTLAYAHSRGVIHRDLKPANVMVGAFGEVQVVDWGLAKVLASGGKADEKRAKQTNISIIETVRSETGSSGSHSLVGSVMGTPAYMPPEQARGEIDKINECSDVFSLGAILCEILTGSPAYVGESEKTIELAAKAQLDDATRRLDGCKADADLVQLTKECLAPARQARPRDAGIVARRLHDYLISVEERARNAQVDAAKARVKASEERKARKLTLALGSSVLVTVLVVGGGWAWLSSEQTSRERETESQVNAALTESTLRRGEGKWAEALAAAERAQGLAAAGTPNAELHARVAGDLAMIKNDAKLAREKEELDRANAALLAELEDIRQPQGDQYYPTDHAKLDLEFTSVFERHGLHLDRGTVEEATTELSPRGDPVALAAMIQDWGNTRQRAGNKEGALRLGRIVRALDTDETRTRLRVALSEKNVSELKAFAAREDLHSLAAPTLNTLGWGLLTSEAYDESVAVYRVARRLRPNDFVLARNMATALHFSDPPNDQEASRQLTAAVALRPDSVEARHQLGVIIGEVLDEQKLAESIFRDALALSPNDAHLMLHVGNALAAQGQTDAAIKEFKAAIALDPKDLRSHTGLGIALQAQGKLGDAIGEFRTAVEIDPKSTFAHEKLGTALQAQGQLDDAIKEYRRAIELDPKHLAAHVNLGLMLQSQGRLDDAIKEYRRAIELDPKRLAAHVNLGLMLQSQGKLDDAIKEFRAAIEIDPKFPRSHEALGSALWPRGRVEEAALEFRTAIRLDPDFAAPHVNLAWLIVSTPDLAGRDCNEAVRSMKRALELAPDDPFGYNSLCNLGAALCCTGKWPEAIVELNHSIELNPDNDELSKGINGLNHVFLALALSQLSPPELDEARAHLELAVAVHEAHPKYIDTVTLVRVIGEARAAIEAAAVK